MEDFRLARRQAAIQSILGWMRGNKGELLSYEEVRKRLRTIEGADRRLQEIPITSIVGSVNRYTDFTRDFLPKKSVSGERWARVKAASMDMRGLPPVEVYQIGDIYFVQDGNHRVSIARQSGTNTIQAYVRKVQTRVTLSPDIQPDELIIKSEYLDFIDITHIDQIRPETNFNTTSPGGYPFLCQQIEAVKFAIEQKKGDEIPFNQAVLHWHDWIYLPVIDIIREKELLKDFQHRTETDLYIWLVRYQRELVKELGWDITYDTTAALIRSKITPKIINALKEFRERLFPDILRPEPVIGEWRRQQLATHQGRIFADIIIVITGQKEDWKVLEFGLNIAEEEGSQIYGIHVGYPQNNLSENETQSIHREFKKYCDKFHIHGSLVFETTRIPANMIIRRAHLADLVILPLHFGQTKRGGNILHNLIHRCPTPILAIHKEKSFPPNKCLLAYDGSPKSNEALFLAAYLAKFWDLPLEIVTVFGTKKVSKQTLATACEYLDRYKINAEYIKAVGPPGTAVLTFAIESESDLIIAGGYGSKSIKRIFSGSMIDEVTRKAQQSILIIK